MAGWIRSAHYGSRVEMEIGVGRVAADGWLVESASRLPDGGYAVLFSPLAPATHDASLGRAEANRASRSVKNSARS